MSKKIKASARDLKYLIKSLARLVLMKVFKVSNYSDFKL